MNAKPAMPHSARNQSWVSNLSIFSCCLAAVLMLGLSPARVHAQASAGITGTVSDTTGAVIGDAAVTITNAGTGVSTSATTSSSGTYTVTGLNPGVYKITTTAPGFKQSVIDKVTVEVSTTATINVTLNPGATGDVVEVTENAIALNTTQPQLGTTVEAYVVQSLPVEVSGRGRQIDSLQFLAPGTTGSTFSHRASGGVDFEQEIVYNGVPFPQPETEGYTTNLNPPFDMVQEFRVERTTFSAQFGLGQGALTYQMASGTNQYHGNLFEINRNSFFDSVGFFNNSYWTPSNVRNKPPTDHENNYGFTVGGPVWIPKLYNGRDRTFFHYSQEWFKQNLQNTNASTVPTAIEKTGDFSDFVDGGTGALIPIYDPLTGEQFQYNGRLNVIDPARISPTSAILIPFIPDPNKPGSNIGGLDQNRSYAPYVSPNIDHVFGFTVDHNLNKTQNLHYSQWRNSYSSEGFDNNALVLPPNPLNGLRFFPSIGSGYILNYSNAISPTLVATAGIGWFGEINNQFNHSRYSFPAVQNGFVPPNIIFDGKHSPTSWGTGGANTGSVNRKLGIALVNNYLWTKGKNTFNIGVEFRRSYQDDNEEQFAGGHFNFSQRTTSVPKNADPTNNFNNYGSAFASFLLGVPDSAGRINSQELKLRNWDLSPYVQDDIKITPKLTINLGLRWDLQAPFTENHDNIVFFDPSRLNPAAGGLPGAANKFGTCNGCAGFSSADLHYGHIGPRFGVAYQLNTKTVIQGGFSVAFLNGGAYEYGTNKVAVNYGNLLVGSYTRSSTNTNASAFGSWDTTVLPDPPATPFSAGLGVGTSINQFSAKDGFAPYSQQWNINVQREMPWNILFTGAWVGNRVIHLPSNLNNTDQLDPKYLALGGALSDVFAPGDTSKDGVPLPYPNFATDFGGSATVSQALRPYPQYSGIQNNFEGSGTTYYQSAQISAEKRFSNGLSFLVGYTLSRLYDNTSSGFTSFANGALNKYNQRPEYVVSSADEPNNMKISGTYELPIGHGKKYLNSRNVVGQLAGGWQVGWILDYESGNPFGAGQNGSPIGTGNRPNRVPSVSLSTASYKRVHSYFIHGATGPGPQIFNPAGFTAAGTYELGTSLRNYSQLRSPGIANENLNVRKHFYFGERFQGILQLDYFNAFNRAQLNGPDNNQSDSNFGIASSQGQNNSNRQGQIQFKLEF